MSWFRFFRKPPPRRKVLPATVDEAIALAVLRLREWNEGFVPEQMDRIWVDLGPTAFSVDFAMAFQYVRSGEIAYYGASYRQTDDVHDGGTIGSTLHSGTGVDPLAHEGEVRFFVPGDDSREAIGVVGQAMANAGLTMGKGEIWVIREGPQSYDLHVEVELGEGFYIIDKTSGEATETGHAHLAGPRHRGVLVT